MLRMGRMNKWINEVPSRKDLESLTISDLIDLATYKVRRKKPFKAALIDYLLSVGKLS